VKTPTGRLMFRLICYLAIVGAFVGPGTTVAAARSDPAIIMLMVDDLPPTEVSTWHAGRELLYLPGDLQRVLVDHLDRPGC